MGFVCVQCVQFSTLSTSIYGCIIWNSYDTAHTHTSHVSHPQNTQSAKHKQRSVRTAAATNCVRAKNEKRTVIIWSMFIVIVSVSNKLGNRRRSNFWTHRMGWVSTASRFHSTFCSLRRTPGRFCMNAHRCLTTSTVLSYVIMYATVFCCTISNIFTVIFFLHSHFWIQRYWWWWCMLNRVKINSIAEVIIMIITYTWAKRLNTHDKMDGWTDVNVNKS